MRSTEVMALTPLTLPPPISNPGLIYILDVRALLLYSLYAGRNKGTKTPSPQTRDSNPESIDLHGPNTHRRPKAEQNTYPGVTGHD